MIYSTHDLTAPYARKNHNRPGISNGGNFLKLKTPQHPDPPANTLQRALGNAAIQPLLQTVSVRTKWKQQRDVDQHERDAEYTANHVMRIINDSLSAISKNTSEIPQEDVLNEGNGRLQHTQRPGACSSSAHFFRAALRAGFQWRPDSQ